MRILEAAPIKPIPDKARAVIVDRDKNVVIVDYDGCLMFPGGKLDDNEDPLSAVVRETKEELGLDLDDGKKLFTFQLTAENYPERDGTITPQRLVETDYFQFSVPEIKFGERQLTEKEALGKFTLMFVRLEELLTFIEEHETHNERWHFFKQEIMIVTKKLLGLIINSEESKYE